MSEIKIPIPKFLNLVNTEQLLKKYHNASLKNRKAVFDFNQCRWASPYCLSLMLLWMRKVSILNESTVDFICPGHQDNTGVLSDAENIISFLGSWGYWQALERFGINILANNDEIKHRKPFKGFSEKCNPFQFFSDYNSLTKFLESLNLTERVHDVLGGTIRMEDIGSGGLRSIILNEVGKNAFEHGKGVAAHITLGVTPTISGNTEDEISDKLINRIKVVPEFMKNFYEALGNKHCIEMVISDYGSGISRKLRKTYLEDNIVKNKESNPKPHTILRYAFLLHSSSKKDTWYFKPGTGRKDTDYQSPRGLYFVKNIARRNRALIICRSGSSMISFDFLSSSKGRFGTNLQDKRLKQLSPLGGTQICILIPLITQEKKLFIVKSTKQEHELSKLPVKPLSLYDYMGNNDSIDRSRAIVKDIHKHSIKNGKDCILLIDFLGTKWTKESLFPVIAEMSYLGFGS